MSQGAKPVHQSRSRKTRDKLLTALEALLLDGYDFDDISVTAIAKQAGVSPASIYRRFDSKNGFIPVLFDLYIDRMNSWTSSTDAQPDIEGLNLRETLHAVATIGWQQVKSQAHIMRAIMLHGRRRIDLMADYSKQYTSLTLASLNAILEMYKDEIKHPDTDTAARMLAYYFNNMLMERGLFAEQSVDWGIRLSDEAFIEEITAFAYGYLSTSKA